MLLLSSRRHIRRDTHCKPRFREPFCGPTMPFGSMVEHHPIFAKGQSKLHQFGYRVLPSIFVEYALYAGESRSEISWSQTFWINSTQKKFSCQRKCFEPLAKPKVISTDNSLECDKACEDRSWNHCTSTPHCSGQVVSHSGQYAE